MKKYLSVILLVGIQSIFGAASSLTGDSLHHVLKQKTGRVKEILNGQLSFPTAWELFNIKDDLRVCIQSGFDPNYDGEFKPLWLAVINCWTKEVGLLLEKGAHVTTPERNFVVDSVGRSLEIMHMLLQAGGDVNGYDRGDNATPLHRAVSEPSATVDFLASLLSKGADVNALDCDGFTPLHLLAWSSKDRYGSPFERFLEKAEMLLDAGAQIDEVVQKGDFKGLNALQIAQIYEKKSRLSAYLVMYLKMRSNLDCLHTL